MTWGKTPDIVSSWPATSSMSPSMIYIFNAPTDNQFVTPGHKRENVGPIGKIANIANAVHNVGTVTVISVRDGGFAINVSLTGRGEEVAVSASLMAMRNLESLVIVRAVMVGVSPVFTSTV